MDVNDCELSNSVNIYIFVFMGIPEWLQFVTSATPCWSEFSLNSWAGVNEVLPSRLVESVDAGLRHRI